MKKSSIFFIALFLALTGCRRENVPASQNCLITQVSINNVPGGSISYDSQGRITHLQSNIYPESNRTITYTSNQKITESDLTTSSDYEKRVFTFDAAGKVLNIKTYYEYGNPAIDEEIRFTYSGDEIIADTTFESGSLSYIKQYTWQNGNIVKLVVNGSRIIRRNYDLTKPPMQGDAAWVFNNLENVGYYPPTANLIIHEYEEGTGDPATGNFYTFDNEGKIIKCGIATGDSLTFTYQCN